MVWIYRLLFVYMFVWVPAHEIKLVRTRTGIMRDPDGLFSSGSRMHPVDKNRRVYRKGPVRYCMAHGIVLISTFNQIVLHEQ